MNTESKNEKRKQKSETGTDTTSSTSGKSYGFANENGNKGYSPKIDVTSESEEIMYGDVIGTPFTIARHHNQWWLLLKNYRLTEALESEEAAIEEAKNMSWNRIIQVMAIVAELHGKATEQLKKA